jgi:hypothetical protein
MIITMWQLWTERNLIREEGRRRGAEFLFSHISLYAKEINDMKEGGVGPAPRRPAKWAKPLIGILKLNCDASYILGSGSGSWGFVIRDSDGDTVITGRGKVEHLLNAFHAELIAYLQGLQTAISLGIGHLILETDAQDVV